MNEYDIVVGNIKTIPKDGSNNLSSLVGYVDILVDRYTVLGNPFFLNHEDERKDVVIAYEKWLWRNLISSYENKVIKPEQVDVTLSVANSFKYPTVREVRNEINMLIKKECNIRLLCWCTPLSCHADIIKSVVLDLRRKVYYIN